MRVEPKLDKVLAAELVSTPNDSTKAIADDEPTDSSDLVAWTRSQIVTWQERTGGCVVNTIHRNYDFLGYQQIVSPSLRN